MTASIGVLPGPRPNRPATTPDLDFWWDGIAAKELRIQRCAGCHRLRHPPQVRCPFCGSFDWDWQLASGAASLHSFVVYHAPEQRDTTYPYAVGVLSLVEGVRVIAPVTPDDGAGLRMDHPMRLRWAPFPDVGWWPWFEPEDSA